MYDLYGHDCCFERSSLNPFNLRRWKGFTSIPLYKQKYLSDSFHNTDHKIFKISAVGSLLLIWQTQTCKRGRIKQTRPQKMFKPSGLIINWYVFSIITFNVLLSCLFLKKQTPTIVLKGIKKPQKSYRQWIMTKRDQHQKECFMIV